MLSMVEKGAGSKARLAGEQSNAGKQSQARAGAPEHLGPATGPVHSPQRVARLPVPMRGTGGSQVVEATYCEAVKTVTLPH